MAPRVRPEPGGVNGQPRKRKREKWHDPSRSCYAPIATAPRQPRGTARHGGIMSKRPFSWSRVERGLAADRPTASNELRGVFYWAEDTGELTLCLTDTTENAGWYYVTAGSSPSMVKLPVRGRITAPAAYTATTRATTGQPTYLTANAVGALGAHDGVTYVAGERCLLADGTAYAGIYVVTNPGAAGAAFVLTRAADFDVSSEVVSGVVVPVSEGTVAADKLYVLTTNGAITLDTTALAFAVAAVTVGNESAHTHPVLLDAGVSGATSTNNMGYEVYTDPAAPGVAVHAQVLDTAANAFPGPFTNPVIPRNVRCVFGGAWTGGDITVTGTDQDDAATVEVIADNPGNTVQGVCIFKTITAISKELVGVGGGGVDVQTGQKFGITDTPSAAVGLLTCDGVIEAGTWDIALHQRGVIPTTASNGAHDYAILFPKVATTHTHGPGTLADTASGAGSAHNHSIT